jgi:hypothetical protein
MLRLFLPERGEDPFGFFLAFFAHHEIEVMESWGNAFQIQKTRGPQTPGEMGLVEGVGEMGLTQRVCLLRSSLALPIQPFFLGFQKAFGVGVFAAAIELVVEVVVFAHFLADIDALVLLEIAIEILRLCVFRL